MHSQRLSGSHPQLASLSGTRPLSISVHYTSLFRMIFFRSVPVPTFCACMCWQQHHLLDLPIVREVAIRQTFLYRCPGCNMPGIATIVTFNTMLGMPSRPRPFSPLVFLAFAGIYFHPVDVLCGVGNHGVKLCFGKSPSTITSSFMVFQEVSRAIHGALGILGFKRVSGVFKKKKKFWGVSEFQQFQAGFSSFFRVLRYSEKF